MYNMQSSMQSTKKKIPKDRLGYEFGKIMNPTPLTLENGRIKTKSSVNLMAIYLSGIINLQISKS